MSALELGPASNETNSSLVGNAPAEQHGKNASTELATGEEEGGEKAVLPPLDMYNNSLVMPLYEFIEHPVVHELLHNGGTMQVRCTTRQRPHAINCCTSTAALLKSWTCISAVRKDELDTCIQMPCTLVCQASMCPAAMCTGAGDHELLALAGGACGEDVCSAESPPAAKAHAGRREAPAWVPPRRLDGAP